MSYRDDIIHLLTAGRAEHSLDVSSQRFEDASKLAAEWAKAGGGTEASTLAAESFKELALNELNSGRRTGRWRQALEALFWTRQEDPYVFADVYASLCVDICQDVFASMDTAEQLSFLRSAKQNVDAAIMNCEEQRMTARLLARRSSIIRHQALNEPPESRFRMLQESHRCATLAFERNRDPNNILELTMAEWSLARYENSDEAYVARLSQAEALLMDREIKYLEASQYALVRLYRLTYRYFDTCEIFPHLTADTMNRRRLLRESPIYGEAVAYLAESGYPSQIVKPHLERAANLLEMAIAAGYRNARVIVALAFIRGHLDGTAAGLTALEEICDTRGELSWDNILGILGRVQDSDLPLQGFVLGINHSTTLTRLGTFARRFLDNDLLAEALYRAAVRVDSQEPVSLTNLARFLVQRAEPADLREAQRLLQLAQTFADRRFRWWRDVLEDLQSVEKQPRSAIESAIPELLDLTPIRSYKTLRQIRHRYRRIAKLQDAQKRGYELESLIYAIAYLTFGIARPSYRFQRPLVEKTHQVDGYFPHRGEKYRCECKWADKPVGYDDILKFEDKLDVVGVSGLIVSMGGFDEAAITKSEELRHEKQILLMDREEIDLVMKGILNFDEVMTLKSHYFYSESKTYYRIVPKKLVQS